MGPLVAALAQPRGQQRVAENPPHRIGKLRQVLRILYE